MTDKAFQSCFCTRSILKSIRILYLLFPGYSRRPYHPHLAPVWLVRNPLPVSLGLPPPPHHFGPAHLHRRDERGRIPGPGPVRLPGMVQGPKICPDDGGNPQSVVDTHVQGAARGGEGEEEVDQGCYILTFQNVLI
jgi:hypothetical protein